MAFEAILSAARHRPEHWKRATVALSLVLHAAVLVLGVLYSFWRVEELPLPTVVVTLMAGMPPPPPPPPPPPAGGAKKHSLKPKTKPVEVLTRPELVQPVEAPKEAPPPPKPQEDEDEAGVEGGVKGGVVGGVVGGELGGVKGGVLGGVVGGTPPPPARDKDLPRALDTRTGHGRLAIDPDAEAYKVRVPSALNHAGMLFSAIVRVAVNAQGTVTGVTVLKGADPAIDAQIPVVIRRWRYHPYIVEGRAVPFTYAFRYDISAR